MDRAPDRRRVAGSGVSPRFPTRVRLLETVVVVVVDAGDEMVIHAMPARKKDLDLLPWACTPQTSHGLAHVRPGGRRCRAELPPIRWVSSDGRLGVPSPHPFGHLRAVARPRLPVDG